MTPTAFARELAARVAASLPDGFTASAEGEYVTIAAPDGTGATTSLHLDPDELDDPDAWADAGESVLSLAQEVVTDALGASWPGPAGRQPALAFPSARAEGGVVSLWYGDEDTPILRLPEIRLAL